MKLSEKRKSAIYAAIHEEIMELRLRLQRMGVLDLIDSSVAQKVEPIYHEVLKVLQPERSKR